MVELPFQTETLHLDRQQPDTEKIKKVNCTGKEIFGIFGFARHSMPTLRKTKRAKSTHHPNSKMSLTAK